MNVYKIEFDGYENNEYYELAEEDFFPPQDDRIYSLASYFNKDYLKYAEWFWDCYGNDIYEDYSEYIEDGCEYKVCGYLF